MAGFSLSLRLAVLSVPCGLADESRGFGSAIAGFSLSVGTSVLPRGDAGPGDRPAWCCAWGQLGLQAGHRPQYTTSAWSISKPPSSDAVRQGVSPTAQSTSRTVPQERHTTWW